jgi:GMP synthase-like glutamine amidotransferase
VKSSPTDFDMRVGLLVCDHVSPDLVGISGDYDVMFRRLLAGHPEVELVVYDAVNGEIPLSPTECDAWLITGSRHSVNDEFNWIRRLEEFIRKTAAVGVPLVGVCFGHQLLAKSLGGTVVKAERGWGVGVKTVQLADGLGFVPDGVDSFRVINSHQDQIERLPDGGKIIGWNEHCPVSAMTVGSSMLGIQGHPEMDLDFVRSLIELRRGTTIPSETADDGIASLATEPDTQLVVDLLVEFLGGNTVDSSPK